MFILIVSLRKNVDVEEVTIDPEAKWTFAEKKDGTVKSEPEGALTNIYMNLYLLFFKTFLSYHYIANMSLLFSDRCSTN